MRNGSPVLFYLCHSLLLKNSKSLLMSQQPFKKFINPKNNAAIKEKHRQEKKIAKKQKATAIEKRFEEKRALRYRGFSANNLPAIEPLKKPIQKQKYPQTKEAPPASSAPEKYRCISNATE